MLSKRVVSPLQDDVRRQTLTASRFASGSPDDRGHLMFVMTTQPEITRTAKILWVLMALFCLRVLGQVAVELLHVRFLPPSEEWFSGMIPSGDPAFDHRVAGEDRSRLLTTNGLELSSAPPGRPVAPAIWSSLPCGDDHTVCCPHGALSARTLDGGLDSDLLPLGLGLVCAAGRISSLAAKPSRAKRYSSADSSTMDRMQCARGRLGLHRIGYCRMDPLFTAPFIAGLPTRHSTA
jgi:hypothetical protein